ncbi:sulfatase-like hydrolase/transferase [Parapedobacter tibetensis]|uniref:sulfatase-like hydrolase/transferase n=1 Tax=Parapedobacter tibetensis TaxID=2972951 RepID=UPI00214DAE1F|nr:sulfatase-like hydrolase/transferase [Parapedobacter tibetensis]
MEISYSHKSDRENQEEKPKRSNILFALADDASFPYMSAYGCEWLQTPAFDRVVAEGVLFTNAYTPNAKCAPSRASILTGRNLANEAAHDSVRLSLKELLFEKLRDEGDPRMFGKGHIFDEYPYFAKNNRDFYERYMAGEEMESPWVNATDFEQDTSFYNSDIAKANKSKRRNEKKKCDQNHRRCHGSPIRVTRGHQESEQ